jgi:hypothetical protein
VRVIRIDELPGQVLDWYDAFGAQGSVPGGS